MKFGIFLYQWLILSIALGLFSTWIPGNLLISAAVINLLIALGLFMFFVYVRYKVFDDIKDLPIKNAIKSVFYKPDFEKISKDMELIVSMLENRVISNPDKVHKHTSVSVADDIRGELTALSKRNAHLPMETRVKLYKFYRKERSLLIRAEKARKYYAPSLYIEECKKLTDRANGFTVNLVKILESFCGISFQENIEWLKSHGYIA